MLADGEGGCCEREGGADEAQTDSLGRVLGAEELECVCMTESESIWLHT